MSGGPLLRAAGIGKRFKLYRRPLDRLWEWATLGRARRHDELWALRGVDLELRAGEAIGIAGRNGAGKTTLMRILAGTLGASEGSLETRGRVLPLLGAAAGLRADLTGRENALLASDLLHVGRGELAARVERISAFAELGEFFERPVASYSRGMRTRLSLAVVASMEADVVLLDEVRGGADAVFRERFNAHVLERLARGAGLVVATQSLELLRSCGTVLVLERGRVAQQGPPQDVLRDWHPLRKGQAARPDHVEG